MRADTQNCVGVGRRMWCESMGKPAKTMNARAMKANTRRLV